METEFTQPPWHPVLTPFAIKIMADGVEQICWVNFEKDPNWQKDALLISKAPEMYILLKSICKYLNSLPNDMIQDWDTHSDFLDKFRQLQDKMDLL